MNVFSCPDINQFLWNQLELLQQIRIMNHYLNKCQPVYKLLFIAGFSADTTDDENHRLIWNHGQDAMDKIKVIYQILSLKEIEMETYISLSVEGYDHKEILNAMKLSE